MKERPILFSGAMVRALLAGSKTQTRRVVKPQPAANQGMVNAAYCGYRNLWLRDGPCDSSDPAKEWRCPYGQPGDRLWVRESHWMDRRDTTLAVMNVDGFVVAKNGSETGQESNPKELGLNHFWKLRPSIHMPRWASRITLEITSVRVERLKDITEADAIAEGIKRYTGPLRWVRYLDAITGEPVHNTARDAFFALWVAINGQKSLDDNPFVWVVQFRRLP